MRISLLALALVSASPAAAALTPTEQRLVTGATQHLEQDFAFLEQLVNQNSGSRHIEGVRKVYDLVAPQFAALGFAVRWVPMEAVGRAGHLIATHHGRRDTKRLLLIGHLDTVFEPTHSFQTAKREGRFLHGPGAADNKGGIVVMLAALRAMHAAGTLQDAHIEVVLTGDEELPGHPTHISRADLIAAGKRADVALDFEGLSVVDGVDHGSTARRSGSEFTLRVTGKTGHSSGIFAPATGYGAAYELVRILDQFRTELPEPNLTFSIGLLAAGAEATLSPDESAVSATGKTNIIPPIALARGDFRALSPEQIERVRAKMVHIVGQHLPHTSATITFKDNYPAMAPTAGNQQLLDRLNVVNQDLGLASMPTLPPIRRGGGDIAYVTPYIDGLVGLGPSSTGDHGPEERVDLESFPRQIQRAAVFMSRLAQEKRSKP